MIWRNLQMDFWLCLWAIRRAQYGDTTFGHDVRKKERQERMWRKKMILRSRGPMHAGFNWETHPPLQLPK